MIVRRASEYQVQMITERQHSRVAITILGTRFELPQRVAENFAAAIEEVVYEHQEA
jgi:hypothetical protein